MASIINRQRAQQQAQGVREEQLEDTRRIKEDDRIRQTRLDEDKRTSDADKKARDKQNDARGERDERRKALKGGAVPVGGNLLDQLQAHEQGGRLTASGSSVMPGIIPDMSIAIPPPLADLGSGVNTPIERGRLANIDDTDLFFPPQSAFAQRGLNQKAKVRQAEDQAKQVQEQRKLKITLAAEKRKEAEQIRKENRALHKKIAEEERAAESGKSGAKLTGLVTQTSYLNLIKGLTKERQDLQQEIFSGEQVAETGVPTDKDFGEPVELVDAPGLFTGDEPRTMTPEKLATVRKKLASMKARLDEINQQIKEARAGFNSFPKRGQRLGAAGAGQLSAQEQAIVDRFK